MNTKEKEIILIKKLKHGSKEAFNKIYIDYKMRLLHFVKSLVKVQEITEDIVQQIFITIWTNRDLIDINKSFSSYLFTIAKNKSLNYIRDINQDKKEKEELLIIMRNNFESAEDLIEFKELSACLQEALQILTPHKREIFELSRNEEKTHEEIAIKLNISKNTVKNHITHSLKTIKVYLTKHSELNTILAILFI